MVVHDPFERLNVATRSNYAASKSLGDSTLGVDAIEQLFQQWLRRLQPCTEDCLADARGTFRERLGCGQLIANLVQAVFHPPDNVFRRRIGRHRVNEIHVEAVVDDQVLRPVLREHLSPEIDAAFEALGPERGLRTYWNGEPPRGEYQEQSAASKAKHGR